MSESNNYEGYEKLSRLFLSRLRHISFLVKMWLKFLAKETNDTWNRILCNYRMICQHYYQYMFNQSLSSYGRSQSKPARQSRTVSNFSIELLIYTQDRSLPEYPTVLWERQWHPLTKAADSWCDLQHLWFVRELNRGWNFLLWAWKLFISDLHWNADPRYVDWPPSQPSPHLLMLH